MVSGKPLCLAVSARRELEDFHNACRVLVALAAMPFSATLAAQARRCSSSERPDSFHFTPPHTP